MSTEKGRVNLILLSRCLLKGRVRRLVTQLKEPWKNGRKNRAWNLYLGPTKGSTLHLSKIRGIGKYQEMMKYLWVFSWMYIYLTSQGILGYRCCTDWRQCGAWRGFWFHQFLKLIFPKSFQKSQIRIIVPFWYINIVIHIQDNLL